VPYKKPLNSIKKAMMGAFGYVAARIIKYSSLVLDLAVG